MAEEDYELRVQTLAITEQIAQELEKLQADGWEVVPGAVPVALYHLRRLKAHVMRAGARGGITIDESKVFIIGPDGKRRD